ncbi:MAG: family 10 glycosylhydrolase [Bacteroidales bacterium]
MKNRIIYICLLLITPLFLKGQDEPKREMRSTWIATVSNLDWPKSEHRNNPEAQKTDLINMFEMIRSTNLNAVFLQVRPECDALYQSAYEPWSRYLTWNQGDDPGYDPLQFAIEEGHKRGIEVHAWLNPYRINASSNDGGEYYHSTHIYMEHPEWTIAYDNGRKILNPGNPEVMSYIGNVVRDLVSNYNIDGVHFDDYFYAYGGTPSSLDEPEYTAYGNGMSLGDWRRDNVNRMMDTVYTTIQDVNASVRFGVSPFGIYKSGLPQGISGLDSYSTIYCDPIAWLQDGTVDYLTPQIYWPTGGAQDFETLTNWWADSCFSNNRHLYPGMAIYKLPADPKLKKGMDTDPLLHEFKNYFDWPEMTTADNLTVMEESLLKGTGDPVAEWTLSQVGLQINLIRLKNDKNALGSVFFRTNFITLINGLKDYLTQYIYTRPAIVPEMTWKSGITPPVPQNMRIEEALGDEYYLAWDFTPGINDRFAVYATDEDLTDEQIINDPANLRAVTFETSIALSKLVISNQSKIVVTGINAYGEEGSPSAVYTVNGNVQFVNLVSPSDQSVTGLNSLLAWNADPGNPLYQVQIATTSTFSTVKHTSDWISDTVFLIKNAGLAGETDHYWRVRAKNGTTGPFSGAWMFQTGYPAIPVLSEPVNLAQNTSTNPVIQWNASQVTDTVRIQISTINNFSTIQADESFEATAGTGELTNKLEKDTWYYIRIAGKNEYGESDFSTFHTFKTSAGEIPQAIIVAPDDLNTVASFDKLEWNTTATTGTITYELQIAPDEALSSIIFNSAWISRKEMEISDLQIEGSRTYYWRVRARSQYGTGPFSDTRSFETGYPTRPVITKPQNLSFEVSTKPAIDWEADNNTDSIYIELTQSSSFENIDHSERFDATSGTGTISVSLNPLTSYYLRIRAKNDFGAGIFSSMITFETDMGTSYDQSGKLQGDDIAVYPTFSSNGEIHVRALNPDIRFTKIEVTDILGKVHYLNNATNINSSGFTILTNEFNTGSIYYVRVFHDKGVHITPVIITE